MLFFHFSLSKAIIVIHIIPFVASLIRYRVQSMLNARGAYIHMLCVCMDGCCLSSARLLFSLSVNICSRDTYFMFKLEEKLKKIVLFRYYIINEEKLESYCFIYTISVIVCQINSISIRNESSIINTSR